MRLQLKLENQNWIKTNIPIFEHLTNAYALLVVRTPKRWFPSADTAITTICTTYLSFSIFESGFCRTDGEFETRLNQIRSTIHGTQLGTPCSPRFEFLQEAIDSLKCKAKAEAASQVLIAMKRWSLDFNYSQQFPQRMTGMHLAVYFGIQEAIKVISHSQYQDSRESYSQTPLLWAAEKGHEVVVKLLLATGKVNIDLKDNRNRTPLFQAAENMHRAVVKLLLATNKVNVNSKDNDDHTLLLWTVKNRDEAVIKLLLETDKVDINSKDEYGQTPL
ncbi:Ankyrin repeat-containing domain protein [Rutstroemia sp. NJR-2017a WRK4]|nr:Ankyrin repeat-containing domain protein [Rutstroemia sp. NJR-2017a WRK4]